MDALRQLLDINWVIWFFSLCILLLAIKFVTELFEWFIKKLGLETSGMKKRREEHELLITTSKELKALYDKQKRDIDISNENDKLIKKDLCKVSEKIDALSNQISEMQDKIDETEMAKLKDTIVTYYKKYKPIGEWTQLESDAFWDLFKRYEAHGGNGYVHTKIEPIMRELNVIE